MNIILNRTIVRGPVTEGLLRIDGLTVCHTLENTLSCLPAGRYGVHLHKCHQYGRKMVIISPGPGSFPAGKCITCDPLPEARASGLPIRWCPMMKPGNGVHGMRDGSILVGKRACLGCLIHPRTTFEALYARLRMTLQRGRHVTLQILNEA
ncbi:MAG: DUF5675 family protein [Bacteroidaceae bacterium]